MVETKSYKLIGDITQLVRVSASHAGSPRFESEYPQFFIFEFVGAVWFQSAPIFFAASRGISLRAKSLVRAVKKG